jgi:energy-coupling factor transporter transmembrane protein EcfT
MINQESILLGRPVDKTRNKLGTISYLVIFIWSLCMVLFSTADHILLAGGLCLAVALLLYPASFKRLMRLRWLIMVSLLAIPPIFVIGDINQTFMGIPYSTEGLQTSLQIFVRIIVVLVSVDGFTNSIDISTIGNLFERIGFRGLGFTMGIALNLLPSLEKATINTWQSLWMRGGLRKQRWHGIRLLLVTIITNAMNRTEQIALAADGRAFNPSECRPVPLQKGSLDGLVYGGVFIVSTAFIIFKML